jgi:hypothetical protein
VFAPYLGTNIIDRSYLQPWLSCKVINAELCARQEDVFRLSRERTTELALDGILRAFLANGLNRKRMRHSLTSTLPASAPFRKNLVRAHSAPDIGVQWTPRERRGGGAHTSTDSLSASPINSASSLDLTDSSDYIVTVRPDRKKQLKLDQHPLALLIRRCNSLHPVDSAAKEYSTPLKEIDALIRRHVTPLFSLFPFPYFLQSSLRPYLGEVRRTGKAFLKKKRALHRTVWQRDDVLAVIDAEAELRAELAKVLESVARSIQPSFDRLVLQDAEESSEYSTLQF